MSVNTIIRETMQACGYNLQSAIDALCDGAYLLDAGITQEDSEVAVSLLRDQKKLADAKAVQDKIDFEANKIEDEKRWLSAKTAHFVTPVPYDETRDM